VTSEIIERDGHEDIRQHVRRSLIVFGALLGLTSVTVAVSYMRLPARLAIAAAALFATFKAGLVAAFFMHLISERRAIYVLLTVAGVLLAGMVGLTMFSWYDQVRIR
jgi:cytochrome c oxidase subunit 4